MMKCPECCGCSTCLEKRDTPEDRMLKFFAYSHLPEHLQEVSRKFCEMAEWIVWNIEIGPERTVALRKLLESKDAAVRARLVDGG